MIARPNAHENLKGGATRLSAQSQGRDNNLNLLRITAAFVVLVSHSFALVSGTGDAEPFRDSLGTSLGGLGVDAFFLASGFLVTGSLLTRGSALEFLWARVLRIYPALLVMLILSILGLGVYFTTMPLSSYFSRTETYVYFLKNATLVAGAAYTLPGVFTDLPYKSAVNGSLWTMPLEIRMYLILLGLWAILRPFRSMRLGVFKVTIIAIACTAAVLYLPAGFPSQGQSHFPRLFFMFFMGAAFHVLKDSVVLAWPFFLSGIAVLALSSIEQRAFFAVYNVTIGYLIFFVAYVPDNRYLRSYNRLGDYSYGLYIYGFPVQQSVLALVPGISVMWLLIISFAITLAFSALSWHFLERHALKLKEHYVGHSRKFLAFFTIPKGNNISG